MRGFVLLPDRVTENSLIDLNREHFSDDLRLGRLNNPPHVTLLQTVLREDFPVENFLNQFGEVYPKWRVLKADLGGLEHSGRNDRLVFLKVSNSSWLKDLNNEIVHNVKDWVDLAQIEKPESGLRMRMSGLVGS